MTAHTQEDAFHEIQLNGKQLVFLFMAATVVSVVIFLCGVLVGRGVRTERMAAAPDATAAAVADPVPQRQAAAPPQPAPAGSDPTVAPPPPAVDDFSYFNRLEKSGKSTEQLKPAAAAARAETVLPDKIDKQDKVEKAPSKAQKALARTGDQPVARPASLESPAAASEPAGSGFAVQVAALNAKGEADAIAKRLSSKGYAAFVLPPATGTPSVYRVRIGKFGTRREAESVAAKLQKEEQFKPWITR